MLWADRLAGRWRRRSTFPPHEKTLRRRAEEAAKQREIEAGRQQTERLRADLERIKKAGR